jgi:UDP-glucose 4-epimerase
VTRVLVTGASTAIGRALCDALLADDAVELVLAVTGDGAAPLSSGRRLRRLGADLARPREVRSLLYGPTRELGIDTMVHAALHRSPTRGGRRAHALDVESTRELLRLGEGHPTLRRFVYRSSAEVYHVGADSVEVIDEEHPLELSPRAPQWVRDRVEADLAVCAHAGLSSMRIAVLRCAEIFAADCGSQLYDYTWSRVCFRPLGYDPMVELLSLADAVRALLLAVRCDAEGVLNVPGADVLPLSRVIRRSGRLDVAVPGPLLTPLYRLRTLSIGTEFRYDMNHGRFHFGNVLDGARARAALGYQPRFAVEWPRPSEREAGGLARGGDGLRVVASGRQ